MQEPGTSEKIKSVRVLSVSPLEYDHTSLRAILAHSKWKLFSADSYASALPVLRHQDIAVVVCERDLKERLWTDLLEDVICLPHAPSLIVTARLADDRLW